MSDHDLDLVICTYDNAAMLDDVLEHLARQQVAGDVRWRVTVVDNNCTDDTAERVARHVAHGRIPGLRRIVEPRQGLTPARLRGTNATDAPWIAFVDDDCMLDPDWVAAAADAATRTDPEVGAFGGQVVLEWSAPTERAIRGYGSLFAEQTRGPRDETVRSLAGAGMVVRREALERSGWTGGPLLEDRVGRRLVSGGDIELGIRIRAAGYRLRYLPACRLRHVMPARRSEPEHALALATSLGTSAIVSDALTSPPSGPRWLLEAVGMSLFHTARALRRSLGAVTGRTDRLTARIARRWTVGTWLGCWQLVRLGATGRHRVVGAAHGARPVRWRP